MKNKKAFTLIELIAVLVIFAILALIVTPLVLNIIRKARVSADKRSIDAYGRSIELAVASYLLDNGTFPTSMNQLTIEYSGDRVECETTKLNKDSSVYLASCTVAGRTVENYKYGTEEATPTYAAYSVGDKVSYNNVTYYVIEDSNETNDTVKLLKEDPLTKNEMNNLNLTDITISEINGYGTLKYGSNSEYDSSNVKQVIDAWKSTAIKSTDVAFVRLISKNELVNNLGYDESCVENGYCPSTESTQPWVYNSSIFYYTMIPYPQGNSAILAIGSNGALNTSSMAPYGCMVRPVVGLNKSADITKIN